MEVTGTMGLCAALPGSPPQVEALPGRLRSRSRRFAGKCPQFTREKQLEGVAPEANTARHYM
jgi:hypothetical protein